MFFFQAEDGIRYYKVTGVQTCALPICSCVGFSYPSRNDVEMRESQKAVTRLPRCGPPFGTYGRISPPTAISSRLPLLLRRSEERRVGKGCRRESEKEQRSEEGSGAVRM